VAVSIGDQDEPCTGRVQYYYSGEVKGVGAGGNGRGGFLGTRVLVTKPAIGHSNKH
jgi:hypothetical protein